MNLFVILHPHNMRLFLLVHLCCRCTRFMSITMWVYSHTIPILLHTMLLVRPYNIHTSTFNLCVINSFVSLFPHNMRLFLLVHLCCGYTRFMSITMWVYSCTIPILWHKNYISKTIQIKCRCVNIVCYEFICDLTPS